jgi:hypothetical protein
VALGEEQHAADFVWFESVEGFGADLQAFESLDVFVGRVGVGCVELVGRGGAAAAFALAVE